MPQPMPNPDGTIQVAPPTQSAFAPQPTQAPPPPMPPQTIHTGTPGVSGAINDLIAMLAKAFSPQRSQGPVFDAQNAQAESDAHTGLGYELAPRR